MIDVIGDDILCDGIRVGVLNSGWPTLRDRARDALDGATPDHISENDHCKGIEEARSEGFEDGKERAKEDLQKEFKAKESEIYEEGFEAGRLQALSDASKANDANRVAALLRAVSEAHDAMFEIVAKRYPTAKIGELKPTVISSLNKIRLAVNDWHK